MRVVLDTNVLVRCTKNASGPARECFRRFEAGQHVLLVSRYLLAELAAFLPTPESWPSTGSRQTKCGITLLHWNEWRN